ncbi:splicing factor U2af large subunit A isoform X3 [Lactuca sativa]|uniref:splicing factor U2af large subunit A isoform X3 n=1 Tax=Lactuca sativa TaxID=4236 RepID=UPI001C68C7B5|nr:splicing factor U2af large subunit A isoform X3 [Lactuca sativa]
MGMEVEVLHLMMCLKIGIHKFRSTKGVKIVRDQRLESVKETEIGIGEVETEDTEIIQKEVAEMREEGIEMKMTGVQGIVTIAGEMIMIEKERGITDTDHVLHHPIDPANHLDLVQKAREQVVLTWHHLLLQLCLEQLANVDVPLWNQLDLVLLRLQTACYLVGLHSICSERIFISYHIYYSINQSINHVIHLGQVTDAPQAMPGMFQNMFPFGAAQLGGLPMMPAQAMTQQATRHARRVYVGGLPPLANEQTIATFFSHIMTAIGGNSAGPAGDAVVNVYINHEKKFAFVEMRTVEEASNAMALDGIIFEGVSVRVRRPTDYNPSLAATLGPSQPNPNLNLAAAGLTPGGIGGAEGPDRIFVGGLPYYFTEVQIRELLESFGPLRGFDLVKDRDTGNSKGYGFCVYEDQAATDVACAALNGLKMGDKTLTVRRATISSGQMKSEQETIMAQAQQHIAMQKMALQVGGFNLPGLPRLPDEIPTKVLCLTEVINADELMDDGEYEEILEDMREEGRKFGDLTNVVIPRPDPNGEHVHGLGKVFLEYSEPSDCAKAKDSLGGRKFGGNVVTAVYYPEDKYLQGDYGA